MDLDKFYEPTLFITNHPTIRHGKVGGQKFYLRIIVM